MEASAFDTNRYVNRLVEAGVSKDNANAQAEALGEMMQAIVKLDVKVEKYHAEDLVEFASIRTQLTELDAKVSKDLAEQRVLIAAQNVRISKLESELNARISELGKDMMRWILTVGVALGLFQSALTLIPRFLS